VDRTTRRANPEVLDVHQAAVLIRAGVFPADGTRIGVTPCGHEIRARHRTLIVDMTKVVPV
jgi:hypothetical protein